MGSLLTFAEQSLLFKKWIKRTCFDTLKNACHKTAVSVPAEAKNRSGVRKSKEKKANKNYPSLTELLGKEMKDNHLGCP